MDRLFDNPTLNFLAKSMDAHTVQHQVIANNMANINTPGYKATEVAFKDKLQTFLNDEYRNLPLMTNRAHHIRYNEPMELSDIKPRLFVDPTTSMRSDGNNIDIDQQMAMMAQNSMEINALTRLISDRIRGMRQVIEGR